MSTHGYDLSSRTGFLCGNSTVSLASPKPTASFLLLEAKHQLPDLLLGRVTKDRTTSDILVRQPLHTKTQDTGGIHGPIVIRISDIPTLTAGYVVNESLLDVQKTRSATFVVSKPSRAHIRVVIQKVGLPLNEFRRSVHLVIATNYALDAHEMAWEMGLLHHDISFRNILLVYKSNSNHLTRALLVDWDSCNKENEIDRNRSGTWEFMSALQRRYPKKPYQVSDDIEGFVHIILWFAMRYLDHDYLEPGIFANLVEGMFKSRTHSIDGVLAGTGSPIKWHAVKGGHPPFHLSDEEQNLQDVIAALLLACNSHYTCLNLTDYQKYLSPDVQVKTFSQPVPPQMPDPGPEDHDSAPLKERSSPRIRKSLARASSDNAILLLEDHNAVGEILYTAIRKPGWPSSRDMKRDNSHDTKYTRLILLDNGRRVYRARSVSLRSLS